MIRVAIVGCGKIADQHVQAIRRIPGSTVIAVCDREPLMASQLAERFAVDGVFSDIDEMLRKTSPDVVHVTTPPQSHHSIALQCLAAGTHVYLEKPFTVTAEEAADVIEAAQKLGKKITAGHNYQFTPEMLRMREIIDDGFLGGSVVHLESHWPYDLGDASYVGPVLGNPEHWVRRLPGQLVHNIISHGIARIAEFMNEDIVHFEASAHQSKQLRDLGGQEVVDELRVTLRDSNATTAYFCFSTQIKPGINQFLVCGPKNSVTVDLTSSTLTRHRGRGYKSYLTFLGPPLINAGQYLVNFARNAFNILRWRMHQDSGMKELIERFHSSLPIDRPPPISYREILLTARIMDMLFEQIADRRGGSRSNGPTPG
jgi:predicted dehydrogenase